MYQSGILNGQLRRVLAILAYAVFLTGSVFGEREVNSNLGLPVFSCPHGFYNRPFNVTLSCGTSGSTIIYTLDCSEPSISNGIKSSPNQAISLLIEANTIIRAISIDEKSQASEIVTQSYFFRNEIIRQKRPQKYPKSLDMEMDPDVTNDPEIARQIRESFSLAPTVSLVAPDGDFFGDNGIYLNAKKSGGDWVRKMSFEWIPPGNNGKQVNCGVRIQGASSREVTKKHNFRLSFQSKFGVAKLKTRIFSTGKVKSYDSLVLRSPTHDSWAVSNPERRKNARYVNDRWAADTQRLMGHPSLRHRWVHLFLNGYYWGIYALTERPDEHFASAHLGGKDEDYDVMNAGRIRNGSRIAIDGLAKILNSPVVETQQGYRQVARLMDIDAFIDYVLYNLYANNMDWIRKNFWIIGKRTLHPQFRFVNWDAEILFWESHSKNQKVTAIDYNLLTDNALYADTHGVGFFLVRLAKNAEFRNRFAQRAKLHLDEGGLLSSESAAMRYRQLLNEVGPLLYAESARWGDLFDEEPMKINSVHWESLTSDRSWLFRKFFPKRTEILRKQLRKTGFLPE